MMSQMPSLNLPDLHIREIKSSMVIQLMDEPKVLCRPITQLDVIQDHSMMYFQQLVMKEGRAALRAKSLDVFKNDLIVEVEILSLQPPFHLEKILKSIFDGLNKNVITDDSLITNAQIFFKKARKSYVKTMFKVYIEDIVTRDNISFTCHLPGIEKQNPVVYAIGGTMDNDPHSVAEMKIIEQTLLSSPIAASNQYQHCHMLFYTKDKSKDVDNMFLAYIDAVRKSGYLDTSSNISIGMYKRHVVKGDERTIIHLVAK